MSVLPKKRFIAGAVCPKCAEMDKIVLFEKSGRDIRECVSCGFTDEIHIQAHPGELDTRVSGARNDEGQVAQVLNFPEDS